MGFFSLLISCSIMFLASAAVGYLPLSLHIPPTYMKSITTTGVGLLVGTAFIVIIPEGIYTVYNLEAASSSAAAADDDHDVIDTTSSSSHTHSRIDDEIDDVDDKEVDDDDDHEHDKTDAKKHIKN